MENTFQRVYALVRQIPPGQTATYGQIARLMGSPRASRIVGCALHAAPEGVPCHRVVDRLGGLSDAFSPMGRESHRLLLELEGVPFTPEGKADLSRCRWPGPEAAEPPGEQTGSDRDGRDPG